MSRTMQSHFKTVAVQMVLNCTILTDC